MVEKNYEDGHWTYIKQNSSDTTTVFISSEGPKEIPHSKFGQR